MKAKEEIGHGVRVGEEVGHRHVQFTRQVLRRQQVRAMDTQFIAVYPSARYGAVKADEFSKASLG